MIISVTGTWMQNAAQAWLVYDLTRSPLYLGIVGAIGSAPVLLFALPAGVIADRYSKHKIIFVTQTAAMIQASILALLVYLKVVQVWHVMLLAACLGMVNAFDMPARQAMVMELVTRDDVFNAISLTSSAFNSGRIIGPSVAGLLIAAAGMAGCFFINALSFLPLIVFLAMIHPRPPQRTLEMPMLGNIFGGMRWVATNRVATVLLIMTAVASLFGMPYATLMPLLAKAIFHTGPRGYGLLLSAPAAGSLMTAVLMALIGHRCRLGVIAVLGSVLFPMALLLLAGAPTYAAAIGVLFFVGVGMMSFTAVSNTILQKSAPDEMRGRVMGLRVFVHAGMAPLGNLQIGALAQWLGPRLAVTAGAVICLLTALVSWWRAPELRASE